MSEVIREADKINCGICDFCAAVHINFIDADGEIFATASVPAEIGEAFIAQFREAMAAVRARQHPAPARRQ